MDRSDDKPPVELPDEAIEHMEPKPIPEGGGHGPPPPPSPEPPRQ